MCCLILARLLKNTYLFIFLYFPGHHDKMIQSPKIITLSVHVWAIPFNIHTPLCTRSIKFEPLRKKDQSADTNTPPEIKKFLPYPSEKTQRSKDADAHNPSETAFSNPSEILVHRGVCILNGMALSVPKQQKQK